MSLPPSLSLPLPLPLPLASPSASISASAHVHASVLPPFTRPPFYPHPYTIRLVYVNPSTHPPLYSFTCTPLPAYLVISTLLPVHPAYDFMVTLLPFYPLTSTRSTLPSPELFLSPHLLPYPPNPPALLPFRSPFLEVLRKSRTQGVRKQTPAAPDVRNLR